MKSTHSVYGPIKMKLPIVFSFLIILFGFGNLYGQDLQNYSGTYVITEQGVSVTLIVNQDVNGTITGTLSSTTGIQYKLEGQYLDGAIGGLCYDDQGAVYFEGYFYDNELIFSLMEVDANNMPDYNSAQYLSFTQSSNAALGGTAQRQQQGQQQEQQQWQQQKQQQQGQQQGQQQWQQQHNENVGISGNEIGDPSWGYKFNPPAGWVSQQKGGEIILGHNEIPGLIAVVPHNLQNIQEVQQQLYAGLEDEGVYLSLSGNLTDLGNNAMAGEYTGIFQGEQVKSRGIGTSSPYGGGVFIIAVTTPEKYGDDQSSAADAIARNMSYFKPAVSDMMQHFAGVWVHVSSSGASTTWLNFLPDGTFSDQYEASYSGDFSNETGNWNVTNEESSRGRWTVRGNKEQGQIIISFPNGEETIYEYTAWVKDGVTYYAEYLFNGTYYYKDK